MDTITLNKLQLHYYFNDASHTMDAVLRNDCEKELLLIFKELILSFDIQIQIESEAFIEGGLVEIWKFTGKNAPQITLIIALISIFLSRIPVENSELVKLQVENLRLDNEIKRNEINKIKHQLRDADSLSDEIVEKLIERFDKDFKIIWHKSNFYKKLYFYPKIAKISTAKLNNNNEPVGNENTVLKNDFKRYILRSEDFPSYIDDEAVIEIISPVLIKGEFHWKGIYRGEIINFIMKDKTFKDSVINKRIEFINGTAIKCSLVQKRKINDIGHVQIIRNEVLTVLEIITNGITQEFVNRRKLKINKNLDDDQYSLDWSE